jgi:hypothetical protein
MSSGRFCFHIKRRGSRLSVTAAQAVDEFSKVPHWLVACARMPLSAGRIGISREPPEDALASR